MQTTTVKVNHKILTISINLIFFDRGTKICLARILDKAPDSYYIHA